MGENCKSWRTRRCGQCEYHLKYCLPVGKNDRVCHTGNIEYERCLDKADSILAIVRGGK